MKVRMRFAAKPKTARLRKHDLWNHTKFSTTSQMDYIDPVEWEFPVPNLYHTSSVKKSRTLIFSNRFKKHYALQASDFHTIFMETVKKNKWWRKVIYSEIFKIKSRVFSRTREYARKDHTGDIIFNFQKGFLVCLFLCFLTNLTPKALEQERMYSPWVILDKTLRKNNRCTCSDSITSKL